MLHRRLATKYSVKDKNNLFSHSVWSAGEINNSLSQFDIHNTTATLTEEYSFIGNSSIKISPNDITKEWYINVDGNNLFNEIGKTVILTVDVYSSINCQLVIYDRTDKYNASSINIPADTPGTYHVSRQISNNAIYEWYRVSCSAANSESDFIFIDNWRLTYQ